MPQVVPFWDCFVGIQHFIPISNTPKMALLVALSPVCPLTWEFVAARLPEGREPDSNFQAVGSTVDLKESNGPNGPNVRKESSSPKILPKATLRHNNQWLVQ